MRFWDKATRKINAANAFNRGGFERQQQYDTETRIPQPNQPPPVPAQQPISQPGGEAMTYFAEHPSSAFPNRFNNSSNHYNAFTTTSTFVPHAQNPGATVFSNPPLQPFASGNTTAIIEPQHTGYSFPSFQESPGTMTHSPPQDTSTSPPQMPFPPRRSVTEDYYNVSPIPAQRSRTMPNQRPHHDCCSSSNWNA
ncbi:hypothetical protein P153DRAFT_393891 [Dothidotthia symphoricarpi CBS 119687]|uniref:Uncharacterized protein n=1 Tax=Dothidotthia symphoricarpi CBS 119687 TaxID=1392245 RepID=A0A6A6AN06_9PLEO|nr:uncharacterized protein P153DRAFT_393891 [Dothidotthia symphoricarpi CBS 119687]KAF2132946.1 hypothetical protein P153DRAFT_393891 [Dothidotthia symphoricarpi CBS 119687]